MIKRIVSSALLVASLAWLAVPASGATASGWGTIAGITVGTSQDTVIAQHGLGTQPCAGRQGCLQVNIYGNVMVLFAGGKVASMACATRVFGGNGCPAGFALPDGVSLGMTAPATKHWRGYSHPSSPAWIHVDTGVPGQSTFTKNVRVGSNTAFVSLAVVKGKVVSIGYALMPS